MSTWTHFWDMHSGGGQKLQWAHIFIEAGESEAKEFFEAAFDRDPDHVTCNCCGGDYSIREVTGELEQITGYHRHAAIEYFEKATGKVVEHSVTRGANWKDYGSRYVERQRYFDTSPDVADGKYQTLAEFELDENVLILRRTKELSGSRLALPEGAA